MPTRRPIIADICLTGRWKCHSRNSGATSAATLGVRSASSTEALLTACRLSLAAKKPLSLPGIEIIQNLGVSHWMVPLAGVGPRR
jgi:hypothetical protein